ncbi:MAG: hypothetical protein AB7V26_12960 [Lysobacterales bacterium]
MKFPRAWRWATGRSCKGSVCARCVLSSRAPTFSDDHCHGISFSGHGRQSASGTRIPKLSSATCWVSSFRPVLECALGHGALHRFVEREPLYRVRECVFWVLGLESEAEEPRRRITLRRCPSVRSRARLNGLLANHSDLVLWENCSSSGRYHRALI